MFRYLNEFDDYAVFNVEKCKEAYPFKTEQITHGKEPWRAKWEKEVIKIEKTRKKSSSK